MTQINPRKIPKTRLPLIVLSDHSSGFIQWIIKWRTKANYNHIMFMLYPGEFVSQGNVWSKISINRYMTKNSRLKFWKIKNLKGYEKTKLYNMINTDLKKSWWFRKYDYLGILGQALGIKKINNPRTMFCSERVAHYLSAIIPDMPEHPSPHDLNELFKKHPRFFTYGYWDSDRESSDKTNV